MIIEIKGKINTIPKITTCIPTMYKHSLRVGLSSKELLAIHSLHSPVMQVSHQQCESSFFVFAETLMLRLNSDAFPKHFRMPRSSRPYDEFQLSEMHSKS